MTDEEKLYLGGAALLALVLVGSGSAAASARSSRPLATPSAYARDKLGLLRARYNGRLGEVLRSMVPQAMPGGSVAAILGFSSIGSPNEDTAPSPNNRFHEIGEFQTEAGVASGPAPNPNPLGAYNRWGLLAAESVPDTVSDSVRAARALVVRLLGRFATMQAGGWRGEAATADRAAIGLANFVLYAAQFSAQSPSLLSSSGEWSLWRTAVSFASFSAGLGGARGAIGRWSGELARVSESERFAYWCRAIARDVLAGVVFSPARQHPNPAYTCLRTWQKLEAGRLLAQELGLDVGWFEGLPSSETATETQRLVRLGAEGRTA